MSADVVPVKCALKFSPPTLVLLYKEDKNGKTRRRSMPLRKFKCDTKIDAYMSGLMNDDPVNAPYMRAIPSAQLVRLLKKVQSAIQEKTPPSISLAPKENAQLSIPPSIKEKGTPHTFKENAPPTKDNAPPTKENTPPTKENAPPTKGNAPPTNVDATKGSAPQLACTTDVSSLRDLPSLGQSTPIGQSRFQMDSAVESLFAERLEEIEEELNQKEEIDVYKLMATPPPMAAAVEIGGHMGNDILSTRSPLTRKLPPLAPMAPVGGAVPPMAPPTGGGSMSNTRSKLSLPTGDAFSDGGGDGDDDGGDSGGSIGGGGNDGGDDSGDGDYQRDVIEGLQRASSSLNRVVESTSSERPESTRGVASSRSLVNSSLNEAASRSTTAPSGVSGEHPSTIGAPRSHSSFLHSSSLPADDQKSLSFDMADQVESEGAGEEGGLSSVSDLADRCLDFRIAGIVTGENSTEDLNKVDEDELAKKKATMNVVYEANRLKPGDEGYVYDKEVEFEGGKMESGWDSDPESCGEF